MLFLDRMNYFRAFLLSDLNLSVNPLVPANEEVEQRSKEWQKQDDQYPHDFFIALKLAGQHA